MVASADYGFAPHYRQAYLSNLTSVALSLAAAKSFSLRADELLDCWLSWLLPLLSCALIILLLTE